MGTVIERDGRYRACIRKKSKKMCSTFSSKELAEIWVKYHEELIENMQNFQVKPESIITLLQCFELKKQDLLEKNVHKKTIEDLINCTKDFSEIINIPIGEITSDMIRKISNEMMNSIVRIGGNEKSSTGNFRKCSPSTILRKLRVVACVFSYMIEKGANITNVAQTVCNQVKMSIIKSEDMEDLLDE